MEVAGELTADGDWGGDVLFRGDVVVPEGRTLRMRAGTALSFAAKPAWSCAVFRSAPEGYPIEASSRERCDLVVFGALIVDGSADRPVTLGRAGQSWGGIALLGSGEARLDHARLFGAAGGDEALVQCFDDSRLELRSCELSRARVGVLAWGLSSVVARETVVEDAGCGFFGREGSTTDLFGVRGRRLEQGVWGQNWALARLEDCRFEDCSDFGAAAYDRSRLSVLRGTFERCGRGLLGASGAEATAEAAEFRGNGIGAHAIESARLELRSCRFSGSRRAGIFTQDDARAGVAACAFDEPVAATQTGGGGAIVSAGEPAVLGGRA